MSKQPEHGLLTTGRYVPRLRLERSEIFAQHRWMAPGLKSRARGQRSMANWDEDAVTMALEAVRGSGGSVEDASGLTLASTSLPFAERINAGIVASALGLPAAAQVRDVTSSARAATTELLSALTLPQPGVGPCWVAAAERRAHRPASVLEMISGDGAAAVSVGWGAPIATLVGAHTVHADFVDHFRESGQRYDYGWEERWVREEGYLKIGAGAIRDTLKRHGVEAADVDHFVMPAVLARVNDAVAKRVGIRPEAVAPTLADDVGDLGCAQPLAMLDEVMRRAAPGALIVLTAFGGGCDVLLLRRTEVPCPGSVPGAGKPETSYLKYLSFTGQLDLEWGMRAEMDNKTALTAAWRDHDRVARFMGGRCRHCGTVQFPSLRVCVNPDCNQQDSQDPVSLAQAPARVLSHTSDFLAYTPHPPFQFGHIDFDGGGRVLMEFTDTDQDELKPGLAVRMVYRIKEYDSKRGFRRYFWKATPVRAAAA
ncbi:3-oxoacyl-[acyl-carrier-protein] synthase III C-terminal domain-containing protein [Hydrogenophaga sp.]|uniref:3-oxoacyl-[acyl-carrier-protein] synthase III C-terminal domain-containing protein n=1 Tax=Hydrogenophaga sp. TaxID=1904254 RepID=UPI00261D88D3|nr:3-oxoacyl-[acyl-carrier-protein] synthase III C-terminal domain-containing protein [Hydrogenophaga sp.]MCW5652126.1 OB-fold domain-containing protein [Hydrogenophaga sp.]